MDTKLINDLVNNNKGEDTKLHLLVVGSRKVNDFNLIRNKLDYLLQNYKDSKNVEIVSGGANGVDKFAEEYALEHGYSTKIFPISKEDWERDGKRAGYLRNEKMHAYIAKFPKRGCVAFWDGKSAGTRHTIGYTDNYGIKRPGLAEIYHNRLVLVNINENFAEELEYDTSAITEFEEHFVHYGKTGKYVQNPVVTRIAKKEELERIDKLLAKRRQFDDNHNGVIDKVAERDVSKAEENELLEKDMFNIFSEIEQVERDRLARYRAYDDKLDQKDKEDKGQGYAGNVQTIYDEYPNLPSDELLEASGQPTREKRDKYVTDFFAILNSTKLGLGYVTQKKLRKAFGKFYAKTMNIDTTAYDVIVEFNKRLEDDYNNILLDY